MQTIFTKVDHTLQSLVNDIEIGTIGLPDIQRPFVWKNAKVRNLFDSMYRGFPVGFFLFWENEDVGGSKGIGGDAKQRPPQRLIVDGQQRLTSLYAVLKAVPVVRENYEIERIEIAFSPIEERFDVADAAIRKDPSFIPDISVIWAKGADLFGMKTAYEQAVGDLDAEQKKKVGEAFTRLQNLRDFPFTVLCLAKGIDEEQVAEVFKRINSEGKTLNEADFILTLMSVFWDEGRAQLERFCREARKPAAKGPSPFNHFIQPSPDQLLRVSVGLGFKRARLRSVYAVLRGKDVHTGVVDPQLRDQQFDLLKHAQAHVLNAQYWHDFMHAVRLAGFRSANMISSRNNLLFAYILYLIGRTEFKVEEHRLRRLIAQWFFMTALTGRYTNSPESTLDFDLARLRGLSGSASFVTVLKDICASKLTSDYWAITLPMDLATAAARSPSLFAFFAALNIVDARVLFSQQKVSDLLDPQISANRSAVERHHLFPRDELARRGVTDIREVNQIGNYTLVEWNDNVSIGGRSPAEYVPDHASRFEKADLQRMYHWHALPDDWQNLEYRDFLRRRRDQMAARICDAYTVLAGGDPEADREARLPLATLVEAGEGTTTEFKSTLRTNLHTAQRDPRMEHAVLKSLAAFLNSGGGTVVIGVKDDGEPLGITADGFDNEDKMQLHLANMVNDRLGAHRSLYLHPRFDEFEGVRVLVVECARSKSPVFVKDGAAERFYVRTGAATVELTGSSMQSFITQRFPA